MRRPLAAALSSSVDLLGQCISPISVLPTCNHRPVFPFESISPIQNDVGLKDNLPLPIQSGVLLEYGAAITQLTVFRIGREKIFNGLPARTGTTSIRVTRLQDMHGRDID